MMKRIIFGMAVIGVLLCTFIAGTSYAGEGPAGTGFSSKDTAVIDLDPQYAFESDLSAENPSKLFEENSQKVAAVLNNHNVRTVTIAEGACQLLEDFTDSYLEVYLTIAMPDLDTYYDLSSDARKENKLLVEAFAYQTAAAKSNKVESIDRTLNIMEVTPIAANVDEILFYLQRTLHTDQGEECGGTWFVAHAANTADGYKLLKIWIQDYAFEMMQNKLTRDYLSKGVEISKDVVAQDILNEIMEKSAAAASELEKGEEQQVFHKLLQDLYQESVLPDGTILEGCDPEHMAKNQFAIADMDGDGQEELLILWKSGSMAGMTGRIYGCEGETVYEELSAFPSIRIYDNGIVEEDFSHNQNLAGDFWPYYVHRYDAESDTYRPIGGVDAWDRRVRENNPETGIWPQHFPAEIDADGDGVVYFLLPADWNGNYRDVPMVDGADFEKWRDAYLGGAKELEFPLQELTEENLEYQFTR